MFRLIVASLTVAVATAATLQAESFRLWTEEHGKAYGSDEEHQDRFAVWKSNDDFIQKHNLQDPQPTYFLGHNEYSDMTQEDFKAHFHLKERNVEDRPEPKDPVVAEQRRALMESSSSLPDYVNWVQMGAVTPVKNQGNCGSCWAFSTTGSVEGAKFVKTGELVALSEQNLLDCDHKDLGCSGGLMDDAFKFVEKEGGLCSEDDYPYEAEQHDTCRTDCTDVPGSIVETFVDVPPGKERALLSAIAMQPVSVAIQAGVLAFQFYKTGVIVDDSCGKRGAIDHGVLAVGYGTDLGSQEPYFLVKNSWGETWGMDGYVKIGRKTKNEYGICSILKLASFPLVD